MAALRMIVFFLAFESIALARICGPEFTFKNPEIDAAAAGLKPNEVHTKTAEAFARAMARKVSETCRECKKEVFMDKLGIEVTRFVYPDGWWFQIALDPKVIEIQAHQESAARFVELKDRMNRDIFGAAQAVGLVPHQSRGAGHIHIDIEKTFGGNRLLFRNYIVDKMNHPELMTVMRGGLEALETNSPALASLGPDAQERFAKVIADFDSDPTMSIHRLMRRINQEVSKKIPSPQHE